MTVQRQYTLPNCNLVLEGLSADANDPLSPMSVLMNVECQLPGATDVTLTGGREFLEHLIAAVNHYAQQILSGITRPSAQTGEVPLPIAMKPGDGPYHHLIVRQQGLEERPQDTDAMAPLDVKLSTVQFYDLVEAIDQLLSDSQTLPDLQPQFQAISRRLVKPAEPVAKRMAPAAIGAAALAAAGLSLFFLPPPEFEPAGSTEQSEDVANPDVPLSSEGPETSEAMTPGAGSEDGISPTSRLDDNGLADAVAGLERLVDAPTITDVGVLAVLQRDLDRRLEANWSADPVPDEDWTYRVAVAENGDILGYKYQDRAALENVETTPLSRLAFVPVDDTEPVQEPVAQFQVSFTPEGEVDVVPWGGTAAALASEPADGDIEARDDDESQDIGAEASGADDKGAAGSGNTAVAEGTLPDLRSPITDAETIRTLNSTLYDSILTDLEPLSANEVLEYQVRVTDTGDIVGYEPLNAAGLLLVDETPLPQLVTSAGGNADQADYRVVFTENGVLEVSPWDGWPD